MSGPQLFVVAPQAEDLDDLPVIKTSPAMSGLIMKTPTTRADFAVH